MSLATWVDSRTLLGCDLLIASIYSCAFFGMRQFYPRLRGAGSFATSYVLVAAAFILYIARNDMPHFVSIVGANALIFASCIFFLQGIFRFFDIKKTLYPAISWFVLATLLIAYFTAVHDNIVDRTAIIGISVFLLRGQAAVELYRQSSARPVIRLFSYVTGSCALLGLSSAIFVFVVPDTLMHFESRQILALILAFASFCSLGLFLLFMLSSELLSLVQDESQQDILTGILNRRGVDLKLALELKRINRSGQKLSIAFIDIDHFKAVNDSSGHAGGDEALRQVSTLIAGRLRAYDLLGRYGGDEFLLVLPQTSWSDTLHVCERIEQAIRKISVGRANLAISTGITEAVPGEHVVSLLARADKALYLAKRSGRDQCRVMLHDPKNRSTDTTDSRSYIAIPRAYQNAVESKSSLSRARATAAANTILTNQ